MKPPEELLASVDRLCRFECDWAAGFGHMIARHNVDFVLCNFRTTEVVAAIELDDRSHAKPNRRRRDEFLNQALAAAEIPLLRIQAASWYNSAEIGSPIAREVQDLQQRI